MSGAIAMRRERWGERLKALQARPLELRPSFPEAAARWNAWWRFAADRPLLVASAPRSRDIRLDKAFDLIGSPAEWLAVRRAQVENLHLVGDTLPWIRADIGPVSMAAYLGAPLHLSQSEQTSWQDPIVEDWEDLGWIRLREVNPWLERVLELLRLLAEDAAGRYLVCLPDLTGAIDALANLRSPDRLCLDLFENRERVIEAAARVVDVWEGVFAMMYDTLLERGAGPVQWLGCWASGPYTVPTCDFNALIGPQDFSEVCLPSLAEQARRAGLCVFHLDGPDAARHAEALAGTPEITAVQYTPGAGTPSATAKLSMFRMLQEAGKPLLLYCPTEEVERLAAELDPRGLVLWAGDVQTPREADRLQEIVLGA